MREDHFFTSGGERCAAWLYRPEGVGADAQVPCVVMAHGFSLTRHDGLPIYAEALARAGVAVLVFDHRFLGDSGGEPRQRFRIAEQREDWRNAWAYAGGLEGIDASRRILWGYSFSGGHVLSLLTRGEVDPVAALVLCPFADGLPRLLGSPPKLLAAVTPRALADRLGRHNTIPVTGPPGGVAAMNLPGEEEGFHSSLGPDSPWRNEIGPGVFATAGLHRPVLRARRIACPLWVGLGERDITVDAGAVVKVAERAPQGQLHRYDVDHFEPLVGADAERIVADQIEFLAGVGLAQVPSTSAT